MPPLIGRKDSMSVRSSGKRSRQSLKRALTFSEHLSFDIVITFQHDLLPSVLRLIRAEE
jgi:hypothetical protein